MNSSHPAKLGWRYLLWRRLSNGVTRAASAGICVGTAAMIIVLSAFNGLESLVKSSFEEILRTYINYVNIKILSLIAVMLILVNYKISFIIK